MKKTTKNLLWIMLAYSAALLLTALLVGNLSDTVSGFSRILTAPAQLTIDYFKLGGVGGTFLNAGLVGLAAAGLFFISRAELTGVSLMAFFLTIGFSFFGINFLNIWPCFLGTWLFCRTAGEAFSAQVNIALFATSLSPFVSEAIFRPVFFADSLTGRILLGIALGCICGFLLPILCRHSPNLHKGYTLYNAAAVAGFIGILLFSVLYRATGHEIPTNTDLGDGAPRIVNLFAIGTSVLAILAGFLRNGASFSGFAAIAKSTGYRCDFASSAGTAMTLVNIGLMGLLATGYYNLVGAVMTAPTAGSILCFLAIAPCGAHLLNTVPIILGYALASAFCVFDLNTQAIIVGLCFAGALSPIAGRFGALSGVLAGLLHACMVTTVVTFHGGFCLYNGGFTCGITAILLVPVLETFFEPAEKLKLLPQKLLKER